MSRIIPGRVSIFISHKVATHKQAAQKIKTILEARAERLDVHICEEILAGDEFRQWIDSHIAKSNMMLVLLPRSSAEITWIASEITKFQSICPQGRLIAVRRPGEPLPDIIRDRQAIDTDQLVEGFLRPLFFDKTFTGMTTALNPRISDADLARDAEQIKDALAGIVDPESQSYAESLIIDVTNISLSREGLQTASVCAPTACRHILNWEAECFSWHELCEQAKQDKGKGTFWVTEMEDVILQVARQEAPQVMSSTFRGRGRDAGGKIFQPHLDRVEFVDNKPVRKPVRFRFDFHEVLTPELVRGAEEIGDVFSLLYLATRVRWEVLNPFLIKRVLEKAYQEPETLLCAQVINSLRVIETEDERHQILRKGIRAFAGREAERISELFDKRQPIREKIISAAETHNFQQLVEELKGALQLNCEVTELLASKYLELVRQDQSDVQQNYFVAKTLTLREFQVVNSAA